MTHELQPKPAELPKLSIDVVHAVAGSMGEEDPTAFMHKHLHRVSLENPVLYDAIMKGAVLSPDQNVQESFRDGAILVYTLLSAQLEAEQMNSQI